MKKKKEKKKHAIKKTKVKTIVIMNIRFEII